MKKFIEEFKAFISRGNVMDMAIGVIIGGAFGAITKSLVDNVITPLLAFLFGAPNTVIKAMNKAHELAEKAKKKEEEEAAAEEEKKPTTEELLGAILEEIKAKK